MKIIDLSLPIVDDHVRWKTVRDVNGDLAAGDLFQATTLKVPCHGFTHVDAQRHFFANAPTIEATPLAAVVGRAKVIDLTDVTPNTAIDAAMLAPRLTGVAHDDRLILKTAWGTQRSWQTEAFWRDAPYLTRDAAELLRDRAISLVAYDFPQDYTIRLLLDGEVRPLEEHVTHDVLLRAGVHMVEYLTNTDAITASEVFLSAAPLNIPDADGAPARVYCIEGL
ncbi:MAG: cyclase family protein [Pseudomonadota bacterium]